MVSGSGPDLVLIHGVTDNLGTWDLVRPALSQSARVHALDLPGHGLSDIPDAPLTMKQMGRSVVAYLEAAGIQEAVVVGNSLGGGVALAVAMLAPERVRVVVPVCSLGVRFRPPTGLSLLSFAPIGRTMPHLGRVPKLRELLLRETFHDGFVAPKEALDAYYAGWQVRERAEYISRLLRVLRTDEPMPWLPSLRVPALVIHGDADRTIPHWVSRKLVERIPDAKLVVLPGIGHEPQIECPEKLIALVREAQAIAVDDRPRRMGE